MSVPLNIDTPTGVSYTINHSILVDATGRVTIRLASPLKCILDKEGFFMRFIDASKDISIKITTSPSDLRQIAYELLGYSEHMSK